MTIFILWGVAIPVLSMNLLIAFLSDTYTRVYEQKEKAKYSEMCNFILEIETLISFGQGNREKKHMVFTDVITFEKEETDDLATGIGQKVTSVGKKVSRKIA
jgi:hypothetical protein